MAESRKFNFDVPVTHEGFIGGGRRDIVSFFDDFIGSTLSTTDNANIWLVDATDATVAGTIVIGDGTDDTQATAGGYALMTTEATDGDQICMKVCGSAFQLKAGYELYFEARVTNDDMTDGQLFVGLNDQSNLNPCADTNVGIGFHFKDDKLYVVSDDGGTANADDTGIVPTDGQWNNLAFYYDGDDTVTFYRSAGDDPLTPIHKLNVSVSGDEVPVGLMMTPTVDLETDTGANTAKVDYVFCQQRRARA